MRYITFSLPGFPQLSITAREVDGKIELEFVIDESSRASLQGVFFNSLNESGIKVSGSDITGTSLGSATKAGPGTSINGSKGNNDGFDFGLGLGGPGRGDGIVQNTTITLESTDPDVPLTLDVLSHQLLGVRLQNAGEAGPKHVMTMPAAPDAIDDDLPAQVREDVTFSIDAAANDTDADGDDLTIVAVDDPANGTAVINATTNQIEYTSDLHFSGFETFTYQIADGTGGFDTATVTIAVDAVADAASLSAQVVQTLDVHEVVIDISSALVDLDGSEDYVLRISGLGEGATLTGATYVASEDAWYITDPDGLDRVTVLLEDRMSHNFDVTIQAISTETDGAWNWDKTNDVAISSSTVNIDLDFTDRDQTLNFEAVDQSQWDSGSQFVFTDNRFLGVDTAGSTGWGGFLSGNATYDFRMGLESDLRFEGGEVDATVPWDLSVDSTYNRTSDVLQIETGAAIADGGFFSTQGPELTYMLDLVIEAYLQAAMSIVLDLGLLGSIDEELFNETFLDLDQTFNLIDFDSKTSPSIEVDLPLGISGTFTWPNLEVAGTDNGDGTYGGSGASNNFFDLNLDIDQFIADVFFGGANPFDVGVDLEVVYASLELLDADIFAGMNFLQSFFLDAGSLDAELVFEDGSRQDFTFGDTLVFANASDLDVNGNGDVEFAIDMDLVGSTFDNDTDLGFNGGWSFDLLKGKAGYDIVVASDEVSFGPLVDLGGSYPIGSVSVYDNTFQLDFNGREYSFFA